MNLLCLCFQASSSKGNKDVRGGRSVHVKRRGRMEREEELSDRLQELVTIYSYVDQVQLVTRYVWSHYTSVYIM